MKHGTPDITAITCALTYRPDQRKELLNLIKYISKLFWHIIGRNGLFEGSQDKNKLNPRETRVL